MGSGVFFGLQGGERRNAVVSSLVKYLGPEAASFIHYEEKVSCSVVDILCEKCICFVLKEISSSNVYPEVKRGKLLCIEEN